MVLKSLLSVLSWKQALLMLFLRQTTPSHFLRRVNDAFDIYNLESRNRSLLAGGHTSTKVGCDCVFA